ncbi:MAG: SDR family oxidoreductase [Maricaulaceae bacterium]|nr:SDR family oxidoreductase [Maricaulaceae bacterium]
METVLITGANRGLGLAHAALYLQRGRRVIAACRNPGAAAALNALDDGGGRLSVHAYDAADPASARALAAAASGPVDVLFANAGLMGPRGRQGFGAAADEAFIELMRVNAQAPLALAEAFADRVAKSQAKKIVLQSSRMGSIGDNGSGGYYAYRASKAALNAVGKSLAIDLRPRGIAVAVLHPGWVKTDMGGPGATLTAEDSARGQQAVIDALTLQASGRFFNYDGREIEW